MLFPHGKLHSHTSSSFLLCFLFKKDVLMLTYNVTTCNIRANKKFKYLQVITFVLPVSYLMI